MQYNESPKPAFSVSLLLIGTQNAPKHIVELFVKLLTCRKEKENKLISKKNRVLYQNLRVEFQIKTWQRDMVYHTQQFQPFGKREKKFKGFKITIF